MLNFDPEHYVECIGRTLHTCQDVLKSDTPPTISPERGPWKVLTWSAFFEWGSGEKFRVQDYYHRPEKDVFRTFSYHLMDANEGCIFRFDTHGNGIPAGSPCHVHIGVKEEIFEDDDARLRGLRLSNIDFLLAFGWVNSYLKDKKLPWEY